VRGEDGGVLSGITVGFTRQQNGLGRIVLKPILSGERIAKVKLVLEVFLECSGKELIICKEESSTRRGRSGRSW
jgi:hypothetical protein